MTGLTAALWALAYCVWVLWMLQLIGRMIT
jgi:hypothetical protein